MGIINKIKSRFEKTSTKALVDYGGFELLTKLTGSNNWDKTRMLESYEKSLYVFACVSKIAEKVADADLDLFQILNSSGDTKEVMNHPAIDLLYRVNPFQTKTEFWKITTINLKLAGDAFWHKVRNDAGQIAELWNLRPDFMTIVKDPEDFIAGYEFARQDGVKVKFAPEDIIHFKTPTPLNDYFGVSPVSSAAIRIETEEYAGKYQRDFFLNSARPDAVLKTTENAGNLTAEQVKELKDQFEKKYKGVGKTSKVAILQGGLEYQQISISQREMDYIESMKFTRDDILVAFHVPKPIVAITDDVNRANAETAMYIFLSETIKPTVKDMIEKINEEMIIPDFGEIFYLDFKDMTPDNREQTRLDNESGIKNGYYLINEVRQREGLEPIDGGDTLYMPLNMVAVGGLTKQSKAKFRKNWEDKKAHEEKQKRARVFRGKEILLQKFKIMESITKALKKQPKKDTKALEKDKKTKGTPTALIKDNDLREKYVIMVNKAIDQRADLLKKALSKIVKAQNTKLVSLIKKQRDLTKAIGKDSKSKINAFFKGQEEVFAEFLFPFIEEYTRGAGLEAMMTIEPNTAFEMTDKIREALVKRAAEFGLGVNETTRVKIVADIEKGLEAGEGMTEISNRINETYKEFPTWRSDLIARTEATAASNEGTLQAYKQSEVATHKEWISTKDDRTRPEHVELDGEIVKVGGVFSNGLQYPQEPNCRCVIGPAFEE